jgi:hypothetical protein
VIEKLPRHIQMSMPFLGWGAGQEPKQDIYKPAEKPLIMGQMAALIKGR